MWSISKSATATLAIPWSTRTTTLAAPWRRMAHGTSSIRTAGHTDERAYRREDRNPRRRAASKKEPRIVRGSRRRNLASAFVVTVLAAFAAGFRGTFAVLSEIALAAL